jgi:hypothetical protein
MKKMKGIEIDSHEEKDIWHQRRYTLTCASPEERNKPIGTRGTLSPAVREH